MSGRAAALGILVLALLVACATLATAQEPPPLPIAWETGGPPGGTLTGLTHGVIPDRYMLVAATQGGGIFTSDDQGASWTRSAGLTSYFITCITTSPHDARVLYAGVEAREDYIPIELRSKLVKSVDGGLTWFESSAGIKNDAEGRSIPGAIAVSTTDPTVVYLGCSAIFAPRFYKSTDGGATWTPSAAGHDGYSYAVCVSPADGDFVLSASDLGVFRSLDGAASWSFVGFSSSAVGALAILPAAPDVVLAGDASGIRRSTDGGLTWNPFPLPGSPTDRVNCFAFDPGTGNAYAGTDTQGVFVSGDAGASWSRIVGTGEPLREITCLAPVSRAMVAGLLAGTRVLGAYWSDDGGDWAWSSEGLWASHSRAIRILDNGRVLAGVLGLGVAYGPEGLSWTFATGMGPREAALDFCEVPGDPPWVYAGSDSGVLYRSVDQGASWTAIASFPGPITGIEADLQTPGRLYCAVWGDSFYVSEDGGATWAGHAFPNVGFVSVAANPLDGARVVLALHRNGWGLLRSVDAGQNWSVVSDHLPTNLAWDPSDTSYAYCAGGLDWGMWRSADGGATWALLASYPGGGGSSHVAVGREYGYVWGLKNGRGVYLSRTHGDAWLDASGDLVNRTFYALDSREVLPSALGAAGNIMAVLTTDGAGVWSALGITVAVPYGPPPIGSAGGPRLVAWPNPFRSGVELRASEPRAGPLDVRVWDISGRLVRRLSGNTGSVRWDGLDAAGRPVPPGLYFVRPVGGTMSTRVVHLD
ncbi:MAG: hypothetical protein A2W00_00715 [Candidatus Eisenbacteria bacterium RBG_16_71_46]|nr:MAG: hypothetical protein A2W00_00715 [Candidatus Eisenbacteria bacterium RBG_16_71_46]